MRHWYGFGWLTTNVRCRIWVSEEYMTDLEMPLEVLSSGVISFPSLPIAFVMFIVAKTEAITIQRLASAR